MKLKKFNNAFSLFIESINNEGFSEQATLFLNNVSDFLKNNVESLSQYSEDIKKSIEAYDKALRIGASETDIANKVIEYSAKFYSMNKGKHLLRKVTFCNTKTIETPNLWYYIIDANDTTVTVQKMKDRPKPRSLAEMRERRKDNRRIIPDGDEETFMIGDIISPMAIYNAATGIFNDSYKKYENEGSLDKNFKKNQHEINWDAFKAEMKAKANEGYTEFSNPAYYYYSKDGRITDRFLNYMKTLPDDVFERYVKELLERASKDEPDYHLDDGAYFQEKSKLDYVYNRLRTGLIPLMRGIRKNS